MKVEDILKRKGTRIITVRVGETVEVAARLLKSENVGALVVKDVCRTEGNVVVGMFSERDIARALLDHGAAVLSMPVSTLMSRTLVSCSSADPVETVLELMERHHLRHLPVIDDQTLVGVVSVRDLIRTCLEAMQPRAALAGTPAMAG